MKMSIENKTIEKIDTENFDNMLQSLSSKIGDNIEKKEVLNEFILLESKMSIDLDLWMWKNWEYYIILWKNHEKHLKVWLNKEELINLMKELPILLDAKNVITIKWNQTERKISYWKQALGILFNSKPSNIFYNYNQWKNWYKDSDNYFHWLAKDNIKFIENKNNKIEEIFVFIKFLREEKLEKYDINNWMCEWSVNDECIQNLWFQSNYFED